MKRKSVILLNSINSKISEINFKITKKLGEGMFSTVKLATHSLTGEQVAIKILEKTRISKKEDKERIDREISILKKLNHFNISKLYQVVENKLTIYLIQEYIPGKEFIDYLNKKGKLEEIEACKFYHQIISGLEYIHQCGIAHRDFKPENILLTNENTILKIIDFGLGNFYKNNQLLSTACGSPCYIPPEMIKEENYNGALCDIWSSGIILYLMLCGKLPFYHEQNEIMFKKILTGKFDLPKHLSDNAKNLLCKILEVEPKKRIKFEGIKNHPWFNIIEKDYLMHKGININEDIKPIDEEIVQNMEKMGFNKMEIRYSLIKNFHNKVTTVYDLLLKQKIDSGRKSVGDMKSDLFDEYVNDEKNKIKYYGSLENTLKNRICDDNKKINILPNYYEDKYDDSNENIVTGDNGSVIERLIKAGRFTYDEENMCLNRVTNTNKPITKKEYKKNNDGESKFKTLTQMKTTKSKKNQKTIPLEKLEEKKNSKNPQLKSSQNKKVDKNIKTNKNGIKNEIKNKEKIDNDYDEDEDNDWYKEVETMITEKSSSTKQKKSSSVQKRKNKELFKNNSKNNNIITKKVIKDSKKNKDNESPKYTKIKNGNNNSIKSKTLMNSKSNTNKNFIKNGKKTPDHNNKDILKINKTSKNFKKKNMNKSNIKKFEIEDDSKEDIFENINNKKGRAQSTAKRNRRVKI